MEKNDYERIATLETQLETLTKSVYRIETKLDSFTSNFVTRNESDIRFQNVENKIENVEKEVEELKENKKANNALLVSATSVVLTLINLLINLKG